MRYRVRGVDKRSGAERDELIDADSSEAAARASGFAVEVVELVDEETVIDRLGLPNKPYWAVWVSAGVFRGLGFLLVGLSVIGIAILIMDGSNLESDEILDGFSDVIVCLLAGTLFVGLGSFVYMARDVASCAWKI